MKLLGFSGHLSLFAGLPKTDSVDAIDLNIIHYKELHVHGAMSSVKKDYLEAVEYLECGKIDGRKLVTHTFSLDEFNKAVETQKNPAAGALKIIIIP